MVLKGSQRNLSGVETNLANAEKPLMPNRYRESYIRIAIGLVEKKDFPVGAKDGEEKYKIHARVVELLEHSMQKRSELLRRDELAGVLPTVSDAINREIIDAIQRELRRMAAFALQEQRRGWLRETVTKIIDYSQRYPAANEPRSKEEVAVDLLLEYGFRDEAIARAKPIYERKVKDGDIDEAERLAERVGLGSEFIDPLVNRLRLDKKAIVAKFQEMVDAAKPAREEAGMHEEARLAGNKRYYDDELQALARALSTMKDALEFGKKNGLTDEEKFKEAGRDTKIVARELYEGHRSMAREDLGHDLTERAVMKVKDPEIKTGELDVVTPNVVYREATAHASAAKWLAEEWALGEHLVENADRLIVEFTNSLREQAKSSGLPLSWDVNPDPNALPEGRVSRILNSDGRPGNEVTHLV